MHKVAFLRGAGVASLFWPPQPLQSLDSLRLRALLLRLPRSSRRTISKSAPARAPVREWTRKSRR